MNAHSIENKKSELHSLVIIEIPNVFSSRRDFFANFFLGDHSSDI